MIAKLRDCAELLEYFLETAATLGPKLGAILFQLPPYFRKDLAVLDAFLAASGRHRARRSSSVMPPGWTRRCSRASRARNLALCVADSEKFSTPVEITADYGYFRLRDEGYTPEDIARWAGLIREHAAQLPRRVRVFQARGGGQGPAVRAAAAGGPRRRPTGGGHRLKRLYSGCLPKR